MQERQEEDSQRNSETLKEIETVKKKKDTDNEKKIEKDSRR